MVNPNGVLTLNGVTDQELVKILEVKIRHENAFNFNPQQMQNAGMTNVGNKPSAVYNNVALHWPNEKGLAAVHEIVNFLLKKEEKSVAA